MQKKNDQALSYRLVSCEMHVDVHDLTRTYVTFGWLDVYGAVFGIFTFRLSHP